MSSRRSSNRSIKQNNNSEKQDEKKVRRCEKVGCFATVPSCTIQACESCAGSGYTSRWYHISLGEHFCNNCFDNFYRPGKEGNKLFNEWADKWSYAARASKPTLKKFVATELLPYWIRCTNEQCGKWRKVTNSGVLEPSFIKNFKCPASSQYPQSCGEKESGDASLVCDSAFMKQLAEEPLLKNCPSTPFLKRFLPEDVGICPLDCTTSLKVVDNIEPFLVEQCGESTIWVKPDEMDRQEDSFAKQVGISRPMYLGLRNLLVVLWKTCPSQWLTTTKINQYLVCRGLIRIYLLSVAEQVLEMITKKSVINYGIIQNPNLSAHTLSNKPQVLVIGAGISGLAAAKHLQNLGVNVVIFEATSEIGGSVRDKPVNGYGAHIIHGVTNNPLTVLAHQAKADIQMLEKQVMFFKDGKVVPESVVKRTEYELNGLLQGAIEYATITKKDSRYYDTIMQNCLDLQSSSSFCKDPVLFEHMVSISEFALRADIQNISILNWEHELAVVGKDAFLHDGLGSLIDKLSQNLSITRNTEVTEIDYCTDRVRVTTSDGEESEFSKILITIPLTQLQKDVLKFKPSLPEFKTKAIHNLGASYCEKLILEFPTRFWSKVVSRPFSKFSIITSEKVFNLFMDVTVKSKTPTLVAFISEKWFEYIDDLEDLEIVDRCLKVLSKVFPPKVLRPSKWFLTRWRFKKHAGAFGSFLKTGSSAAFDDMALCVDDKLYFAGEATFRNIPGTVTGAYLSGLREASKIMQSL